MSRLAMLLGFAVAFLATPLFAWLVRRAGGSRWLDRAEGALAARKLQARPVPAIGGAAVLLGLGAVCAVSSAAIAPWIDARAAAGSLVLAFLAGALDDAVRGGLRARTKVALQLVAGAPAAASLAAHRIAETPGGPGLALAAALGLLLAAVAAQNALNTFDNADGAATSLGALALALHAPVLAGPLLGFLPWNLNARASEGECAAPTAYLGDAGSHLLGMLLLLVPAAWPVFALPLLDLARLSVRRWRVGSHPWIGDRRHLAHRLTHAGLGRTTVCAALLAIALPALVSPGAIGLALTMVAYAVAVGVTREP